MLEEADYFSVEDYALEVSERRRRHKPVALSNDARSVCRQRVKILSRKVRSKISAVSPDRAVLHQAITEKHLLAGGDIGSSEEDRPVWGGNAVGKRRGAGIGQPR